MRMLIAMAVLVLAGCAPARVPELVARDYVQARLELACEPAWGLLARTARTEGRKGYLARCEDGRDGLFLQELRRRTTFRIVEVQSPRRKRRVVVIRFESPDPTAAFNESFRHETMNLADDVRDILGAGTIPRADSAATPTPAPRPDAPALSDPASDAWLAEQIAKPDAPRLQIDHSFELVYEWGAWRVEVDPLPRSE